MSGPNTDYDPVEVTPLKADQVEAMREAALAAIADATDLDALKQVRLDHAGDRWRDVSGYYPVTAHDRARRRGLAKLARHRNLLAHVVDRFEREVIAA